ncbi:hypothetical protein N6L24_09895 [Cognatishimia sp. SS12]|uniref:hypothetical protein n=1 Tax=Cognatishimia sp. SS12 TaxID=2979465 RepID=UPI00232F04E4|nr:hypothetical protein [Cognatishimia sp. SS12]MDC0738593.1 hypothetical protein [Cognatishimia sp. SS12]
MRIIFATLSTAALVAACAAPPPEPIQSEPRYDKFGNYECDVIPGTNTCLPPDDDTPCILADGTVLPPGTPCPPDGGRDPDDSSTGGGTSTPGTPGRP